MPETEELIINMGPQHPSTHGVLRLILTLTGETVVDTDIDIGFLHRGTEKLAENLTYTQFTPLTDRVDYLAAPAMNFGWVLAVEKLMSIEVPRRAEFIRVMAAELSRIASHLVWLATHALDIGAMTVFLYCFRDRELILDLFEMAFGARMTVNCFRIGGLYEDVTPEFLEKAWNFTEVFPSRIGDYEALLTENRIWLKRTKGVARISADDAIDLGLTGPNLRGSQVEWDIRRAEPYSVYPEMDFIIPIGTEGDVYDRYLCRIEELRQSNRIIRQCIEKMPDGSVRAKVPRTIKPPPGEVYVRTEAPKGELGYYVVSNGTEKPHRVKIRTPSFVNLQSLPLMIRGGLVADCVAAVGSIDIVLGETDR